METMIEDQIVQIQNHFNKEGVRFTQFETLETMKHFYGFSVQSPVVVKNDTFLFTIRMDKEIGDTLIGKGELSFSRAKGYGVWNYSFESQNEMFKHIRHFVREQKMKLTFKGKSDYFYTEFVFDNLTNRLGIEVTPSNKPKFVQTIMDHLLVSCEEELEVLFAGYFFLSSISDKNILIYRNLSNPEKEFSLPIELFLS